jgi:hypothetical protein
VMILNTLVDSIVMHTLKMTTALPFYSA